MDTWFYISTIQRGSENMDIHLSCQSNVDLGWKRCNALTTTSSAALSGQCWFSEAGSFHTALAGLQLDPPALAS